jgi:hypothetical protein
MNKPSDEQQYVIDKLREGYNVICSAVAGSGKSSTILAAAKQFPEKKIIQLTYNSELRAENMEKVKAMGLTNIEIHTFHSLGFHYYSKECDTDTGIRKVLLNDMKSVRNILPFDMCMLDEYQDNTHLYYRLIKKFLEDAGNPIQLLILGDARQSLYEFKGSDSRFLSLGDKVWGEFNFLKDRRFIHCTLKMSYRITDQISSFVNKTMLNEELMLSCKSGEPIVYYRGNSHNAGKYIVHNIKQLLDAGVKPNDIFILTASVKSTIVKSIENALVTNDVPCYVPTFDIGKLDKRIINGKVVFSTFHSSKGRQRPYVFVLGFDNDYYKRFARDAVDISHCPNVFYVATTRASCKLFVIEFEHNRFSRPLVFLKMNHHEMGRTDFIDFKGTPRKYFETEPEDKDENLIKTKRIRGSELVNFIPDSVIEEISPIIERIFKPGSLTNTLISELEIPNVIQTKQGLFEGVSDLNGTAIPCMLYDKLYNEYYPEKENPGNTLFKRIHMLLLESRENEHTYIRNFVDKLPNPCKTIEDYLFLANVLSSIEENLNYRLKQIDENDYDWLSYELVETCMERYKSVIYDEICEGSQFEAEKYIISPSMIGEQEQLNRILSPYFMNIQFEFSGILDLMTEKTVFEFKCTGSLTLEHKIQLLFYAWVYNVIHKEPREFKLYNVKTNELLVMDYEFDDLTFIIVALLKGKYEETERKTDEEFIEEYTNT